MDYSLAIAGQKKEILIESLFKAKKIIKKYDKKLIELYEISKNGSKLLYYGPAYLYNNK